MIYRFAVSMPGGRFMACAIALIFLGFTMTMASAGTARIRSKPPALGNKQQQLSASSPDRSQTQHWHDVYIAGFFALSDHDIESALGLGVMPAIKLALRHLTKSNFLQDYRLHLLHNDTQVSDHSTHTLFLSTITRY